MKVVLYAHSVVSDWNNDHAHFLRGILSELDRRGHIIEVLEPDDGWSRVNLIANHGTGPLERFAGRFPHLDITTYGPGFDHAAALDDADVVIVHDWTPEDLVKRIGRLRQTGAGFVLLFHDTHHRGVSEAAAIEQLPLDDYDAVLTFGETLRRRYERLGWGRRAFTWHEAADATVFRPQLPSAPPQKDLIWIGNWGDAGHARELGEFLVEPAREAGLSGTVHGVRYPPEALDRLAATGLEYQGWLPNAKAPETFAQHRMTVHIPYRPYVQALPGIPSIRIFEALACGIPLVSAPWQDEEELFRVGQDFLMAQNGAEMTRYLKAIRDDQDLAQGLVASGLHRINERHTCAHRVDELLAILTKLSPLRTMPG